MLSSDLVNVDIFIAGKYLTSSDMIVGDADKVKGDIEQVWGYKKENILVVAYNIVENVQVLEMSVAGRLVKNEDSSTEFIEGTIL